LFTGDERWIRLLAESRYLETGDQKAFVNDLQSSPHFRENTMDQFRFALLDRDYTNATTHLADLDQEWGLKFFEGYIHFRIWHPRLLQALIFFEQDEEDKAMVEVENVKTYYEETTGGNSILRPYHWSELSICYALEGKADRMELAKVKAREITDLPYYKYRNQARNEVRIAIAYLVLDDHDKAIETLEAASKMDGSILLNRELDLWFIFDRLKGKPRFDALLKD
jgi:tetratricopeptide (TPR) repeat protein